MTTAATPSTLAMERLRATHVSWKDAEEVLSDLHEKRMLAKKTRDERREAVLEAEEEEKSDKVLADLSRDFAKSDKKFSSIDRDYRSRNDLTKKLERSFVENAEKLISGEGEEDLFKGDESDAWRGVLLADLIGDLHARPFCARDMQAVGAFIETDSRGGFAALVKSGDITKEQVLFVQRAVGRWLSATGRHRHATDGIRAAMDKARVAVPAITETKGVPQIQTDADGVVIGADAEEK